MIEINNELLAAYAEGNVSQEECEAVRQYLADNPEEMEAVMMLMTDDFGEMMDDSNLGNNIDAMAHDGDDYLANLGAMLDDIDSIKHSTPNTHLSILPMTAMAAQNTIDTQCVIRCEGIALRHFGIDMTDEDLMKLSEREGWLKPEGTALYNIGNLASVYGLSVSHRYQCSVNDIHQALSLGHIVIAVVDEARLNISVNTSQNSSSVETNSTPNHAIIIESIIDDTVTIRDSSTPQMLDSYPLSMFLDSWKSSCQYLVIISKETEYIPHPINLGDVDVEDELIELREAIAENAHEVWAEARRAEGWTYGPVRDDQKKQNPDMLPYNRLPESEKEYDRIMAMNTIKLVKKLGWEFKKKK